MTTPGTNVIEFGGARYALRYDFPAIKRIEEDLSVSIYELFDRISSGEPPNATEMAALLEAGCPEIDASIAGAIAMKAAVNALPPILEAVAEAFGVAQGEPSESGESEKKT